MDKYIPLNFNLLRHPANWFIVWLMLAFAALAYILIKSEISETNEE